MRCGPIFSVGAVGPCLRSRLVVNSQQLAALRGDFTKPLSNGKITPRKNQRLAID
jgi:hypothetical protein